MFYPTAGGTEKLNNCPSVATLTTNFADNESSDKKKRVFAHFIIALSYKNTCTMRSAT